MSNENISYVGYINNVVDKTYTLKAGLSGAISLIEGSGLHEGNEKLLDAFFIIDAAIKDLLLLASDLSQSGSQYILNGAENGS